MGIDAGSAGTGGMPGMEGLLLSEAEVEMVVVLDGARLTYFGLSLEYLRGALAAPLGGSIGRSHSPHAGAFTRSLETLLDVFAVCVLPFVWVDLIESVDGRLFTSSEPFRAGRGGGIFRVGSGGGAGLFPTLVSTIDPLSCSGGLLTDFCFFNSGLLVGTCGVARKAGCTGRGGSPGTRPI